MQHEKDSIGCGHGLEKLKNIIPLTHPTISAYFFNEKMKRTNEQ